MRPTCSRPTLKRRAKGNAAPSSRVGTNTMLKAATPNRALMPASSLAPSDSTEDSARVWASTSQRPSRAISSSAINPAPAISKPNTPQGSRRRSTRRASKTLPKNSPVRYVASTTAKA
ncbi:hypothetical protein D3C76_1490520 [compost metagenome]